MLKSTKKTKKSIHQLPVSTRHLTTNTSTSSNSSHQTRQASIKTSSSINNTISKRFSSSQSTDKTTEKELFHLPKVTHPKKKVINQPDTNTQKILSTRFAVKTYYNDIDTNNQQNQHHSSQNQPQINNNNNNSQSPMTRKQNNSSNNNNSNKTPASLKAEQQKHNEAVMEILKKINSDAENTDWAATDPSTGVTDHPDYKGVLINPDLILKGDELEQHYKDSWNLYQNTMGSPQTICAPMVEQSELPFRILSNRYSIDLKYTPMLNSNQIHTASHLQKLFEVSPNDEGKLTVQICGASIDLIMSLCTLIKDYAQDICDININLGCPQGIAKRGRYGSFLLEETLHVQRIVRTLKDHCHVPVTVKMRKLLNDDTYERTISYAKALQDSGASIITLHGRTRNNKQEKLGQVDLEAIKLMKSSLKIPMFSNGGVGSFFDAKRIQKFTGTDGIMISEGLLGFPTLIKYPIRRSQLLGPSERSVTEEPYYYNAHEVETMEQRKHYSYPQFDETEGLKDYPLSLLSPQHQKMPLLSASTSIDELKYIDTYAGPDNIQIAAELVELSQHYSNEWLSCLRPHLFKIIHRELTSHTDLRLFYAISFVPPRVDYQIPQMIRQREIYAWEKFKEVIIGEVCKMLNLPPGTPLEQIDTTPIPKEKLTALLQSFDFKAFAEHLDVLPHFSAALQMIKDKSKGWEEVEKEFMDPILKKKAPNDATTTKKQVIDGNNDTTTPTPTPPPADEGRKVCCDELNHPNEQDTTTTTQHHDASTLRFRDGSIPQLDQNHKYPASTHPWAMDKERVLFVGSGKKPSILRAFKHETWFNKYEQWCVDHGYLQPSEHLLKLKDNVDEEIEEENEEQTKKDTGKTVKKYIRAQNVELPKEIFREVIPTLKGRQVNSPGGGEWTARHIQDDNWVRILKLDEIDSTSPLFNPNDTKSTTTATKLSSDYTPSPLKLGEYIAPLPLESLWFFERLYSAHKYWYYRYEHQPNVIHLPVDEESIKDQLHSMLATRQDREKKLVQAQMEKGQPGLKPDERLRMKELKEERKNQQRALELTRVGVTTTINAQEATVVETTKRDNSVLEPGSEDEQMNKRQKPNGHE